jgi:hypothetical protein
MGTLGPDRWDAFISYARGESEPFAKRLHSDLQTRIAVWWDRAAMASRGRSFLQEIRDAIDTVHHVILVVDAKAARSDYVRVEWEFALEKCKIVIPILRAGEMPEPRNEDYQLIPPKLKRRNFHCIDFRPPRRYEEALDELWRQILGPPPALAELHGVPTLPPHFLPRRQEQTLEDLVLADLARPVVISSARQATALYGMGGIGKSVLAAAFAQACGTRFAFPQGVLWLYSAMKSARTS